MMTASLVLISVICGLGVAWIFGNTADHNALRGTRKRIYAHLLEFRLFADEPRLILRAQGALIAENARLMRLLFIPALISAIPLAWILLQLETVYGYRPLEIGQAAMVTAQMGRGIEPSDLNTVLQTPIGISVETPPVRDFADRQISWRIRATQPATGFMRLVTGAGDVEKKLSAGDRSIFLVPRRSRSFASFLIHPEEPSLKSKSVEWIEVSYPRTESWILLFLIVSTISAFAGGHFWTAR